MRIVMPVASRSQWLRDFLFDGLPEGRLRTHLTARYWRQVAKWMEAGNYNAVVRHVHPDAEVELFSVGTYRGRGGWEEGIREWFASFQDSVLELREFIRPGGAEVVCVGDITGRGAESGIPVEREMAFLIRVENGMAVHGRLYDTKAEALEALGLRG
jgi:ketosteroid isomerase-like protein